MMLNWKAAATVGTIHALSAAIVFAVIWNWMEEIFSQYRDVFILGYVVCSLVAPLVALLFKKIIVLIVIATLIPYASSELGYLVYYSISQLGCQTHRDAFVNIIPFLFFPFLLTAGPIISIFNGLGYLALIIELEKYSSARNNKRS